MERESLARAGLVDVSDQAHLGGQHDLGAVLKQYLRVSEEIPIEQLKAL